MSRFTMKGPGGVTMVTVAPTEAKARNNFRARLHFDHGMSWYEAGNYDFSDMRREP